MIVEHLRHQVTAALRFVDGNSGQLIATPLVVMAAGLRLVRNLRGDTVVVDSPNQPSLTLQLDDPTGAYLPRRFTLKLPRDPNPANAAQPDSLFQAVKIALYPAPAASVAVGWAIVRATITHAATGAPLAGAYVRVLRAVDNQVLARGLSDWRGRVAGEALLAVPGVPAITFGNGGRHGGDNAVLVNHVPAIIEAYFDPQAVVSDAQPPDPDDLEARRVQLPAATQPINLVAGKTGTVLLAITFV